MHNTTKIGLIVTVVLLAALATAPGGAAIEELQVDFIQCTIWGSLPSDCSFTCLTPGVIIEVRLYGAVSISSVEAYCNGSETEPVAECIATEYYCTDEGTSTGGQGTCKAAGTFFYAVCGVKLLPDVHKILE